MDVKVSDEREDVQKKTFTKWINAQLGKRRASPVTDLYFDLRDGSKLLTLLEVLTENTYRRERGSLRVHQLNNVNSALCVLREHRVRLVNISSNDIVDGSAKLTLALVWCIILHWQVEDVLRSLTCDTQQTNLEKTLLQWCRQMTEGYERVDVVNFTSSWSDGLALLALLHRQQPQLFSFSRQLNAKLPGQRLDTAFRLAHQYLGIERLLDPEDVTTRPDKKSVMTYIVCLFQAITKSGACLPPAASHSTSLDSHNQTANATNSLDCDVTSYTANLQSVLEWLQGAAARLMQLSAEQLHQLSLNQLKSSFREHESFMVEVNTRRGDIDRVLECGNQLLTASQLSSAANTGNNSDVEVTVDDSCEIGQQMALLTERWNQLCRQAVDTQNCLQRLLAVRQVGEADCVRDWLTAMENRVSLAPPLQLDSTEQLSCQLQQHQQLVQLVAEMRARVGELFDVLIVEEDEDNDDAADNDNASCPELSQLADLELHVAVLSERWRFIDQWSGERLRRLQQLQLSWPPLHEQLSQLSSWLDDSERQLKQLESQPSVEPQVLQQHAVQLQSLQSEMRERHAVFARLQQLSCDVLACLDDASAPTTASSSLSTQDVDVEQRLENVKDRWDCLLQIMEASSRRLNCAGVVWPSDSVIVVPRSTETLAAAAAALAATVTQHVDGGATKRRRLHSQLDNNQLTQLLDELHNWSLQCRQQLQQLLLSTPELSNGESQQQEIESACDSTDQKQQQLLFGVQQLLEQLQLRSDDVAAVERYGRQLLTSMPNASDRDNNNEADQDSRRYLLRRVEQCHADFVDLRRLLIEQRDLADYAVDEAGFYSELRRLNQLADEYQLQLTLFSQSADDSAEHASREQHAKHLTSQLAKIRGDDEDCVTSMANKAKDLISLGHGDAEQVEADVDLFLQKWENVTNRYAEVSVASSDTQDSLHPSSPPQSPPPPEVTTASKTLHVWLQQLLSTLSSLAPASVSTRHHISACLERCKELRDQLEVQRVNLDTVNGCDAAASSAAELNQMWQSASAQLNLQLDHYQHALHQMAEFQAHCAEVQSWLDKCDVTLQQLTVVTSQQDQLTDNIANCQLLLDSGASTAATVLSSMRQIMDHLSTPISHPTSSPPTSSDDVPNSNETVVLTQMSAELGKLSSCVERRQKRLQAVKLALFQRKHVVGEVSQLQLLAAELEQQLPAQLVVRVPAQLQDNCQLIDRLADRVAMTERSRVKKLRQLCVSSQAPIDREATNDLASPDSSPDSAADSSGTAAASVGGGDMSADLSHDHAEVGEFLERWDRLKTSVLNMQKTLQTSQDNYDQLKKLMFAENSWLDRLKKKLTRSPASQTDQQSELDDLCSYIRQHPASRIVTISHVCRQLIGANILVDQMRQDRDTIAARWRQISYMDLDVDVEGCVRPLLSGIYLDVVRLLGDCEVVEDHVPTASIASPDVKTTRAKTKSAEKKNVNIASNSPQKLSNRDCTMEYHASRVSSTCTIDAANPVENATTNSSISEDLENTADKKSSLPTSPVRSQDESASRMLLVDGVGDTACTVRQDDLSNSSCTSTQSDSLSATAGHETRREANKDTDTIISTPVQAAVSPDNRSDVNYNADATDKSMNATASDTTSVQKKSSQLTPSSQSKTQPQPSPMRQIPFSSTKYNQDSGRMGLSETRSSSNAAGMDVVSSSTLADLQAQLCDIEQQTDELLSLPPACDTYTRDTQTRIKRSLELYRRITDMKLDVENALQSGHDQYLVETRRIKNLYNKLGALLPDVKAFFECSDRLSRCVPAAVSWLEAATAELNAATAATTTATDAATTNTDYSATCTATAAINQWRRLACVSVRLAGEAVGHQRALATQQTHLDALAAIQLASVKTNGVCAQLANVLARFKQTQARINALNKLALRMSGESTSVEPSSLTPRTVSSPAAGCATAVNVGGAVVICSPHTVTATTTDNHNNIEEEDDALNSWLRRTSLGGSSPARSTSASRSSQKQQRKLETVNSTKAATIGGDEATAAQLAISQCQQSINSMMSELNSHWLPGETSMQTKTSARGVTRTPGPTARTCGTAVGTTGRVITNHHASRPAHSSPSTHSQRSPSSLKSPLCTLSAVKDDSGAILSNKKSTQRSLPRAASRNDAAADIFVNRYALEACKQSSSSSGPRDFTTTDVAIKFQRPTSLALSGVASRQSSSPRVQNMSSVSTSSPATSGRDVALHHDDAELSAGSMGHAQLSQLTSSDPVEQRADVVQFLADVARMLERIEQIESGHADQHQQQQLEANSSLNSSLPYDSEWMQLQVSLMQPDVASVISSGDTLLYSLHSPESPGAQQVKGHESLQHQQEWLLRRRLTAERVRSALDHLRVVWLSLKAYLETYTLDIMRRLSPSEFPRPASSQCSTTSARETSVRPPSRTSTPVVFDVDYIDMQSKVRRLAYRRVESISRVLRHRLEDVERWLLQVNARLEAAAGDVQQQQKLHEEINDRSVELETIRWQCGDLASVEDQDRIREIVSDLGMRCSLADAQCKQYMHTAEHKCVDELSRQLMVSVNEVRAAISALSRRIVTAPAGLRYETTPAAANSDGRVSLAADTSISDEMKSLEVRVQKLVDEAGSLTGRKVNDPAIEDAQSAVAAGEKRLQERRELNVERSNETLGGDCDAVERAISRLNTDWQLLLGQHAEQQRQWSRHRDTWRHLLTQMSDFCGWLTAAEQLIAESAAPLPLQEQQLPAGVDDQLLEQLRSRQLQLERQVVDKHSVYTCIASASRVVIDAMTPTETTVFLEKIETVNRRWKAVLAELSARRERVCLLEDQWAVFKQTRDLLAWTVSSLALVQPGHARSMTSVTRHSVSAADEGALLVHCCLIKSRLAELPDRKALADKLAWPERKYRLHAQLEQINTNLDKLSLQLPAYSRQLQQDLASLQQLYSDIAQLRTWLQQQQVTHDVGDNVNEQQQYKSELRTGLDARRESMKSVLERFTTMKSTCPSNIVPADLVSHVERLRVDWLALEQAVDCEGGHNSRAPAMTSSSTPVTSSAADAVNTTNITGSNTLSRRGLSNVIRSAKSMLSDGRRRSRSLGRVMARLGSTRSHCRVKSPVTIGRVGLGDFHSDTADGRHVVASLHANTVDPDDVEDASPASNSSSLPPTFPSPPAAADLLVSLDQSIVQIKEWLSLICRMAQRSVVIADNLEVCRVLNKHKNVLHELQSRREQLSELVMSADSIRQHCGRQQVHSKVSALREVWDSTEHCVEQRLSQLSAAAVDSSSWTAAHSDVQLQLSQLESRIQLLATAAGGSGCSDEDDEAGDQAAGGSVAVQLTEAQRASEHKSVLAEVASCREHVRAFNQLTQQLVTSYSRHDDVTFLARTLQQILARFNSIQLSVLGEDNCQLMTSPSFSERHQNHSHLQQHQHQQQQQHLQQALVESQHWLDSVRSRLENVEREMAIVPSSSSTSTAGTDVAAQCFKDLEGEMRQQAPHVDSLLAAADYAVPSTSSAGDSVHVDTTGTSISAATSAASAATGDQQISDRLREMNSRWDSLKARALAIRSRVEGGGDSWRTLLLTLRELFEWLIRVESEHVALLRLPTVHHNNNSNSNNGVVYQADLVSLQAQQEEVRSLLAQLDDKQSLIDSKLKLAHALALDTALYTTAHNHTANNGHGEIDPADGRSGRLEAERCRDLLMSIGRDAAKLEVKWTTLRQSADLCQRRVDATLVKIHVFERCMNDVDERLSEVETMVATPSDQLVNFQVVGDRLMQIQRGLDDINDQATRLAVNSVPISEQQLLMLDSLNDRGKRLLCLAINTSDALGNVNSTHTPAADPNHSGSLLRRPGSSAAAAASSGPTAGQLVQLLGHSVRPPWQRALTPSSSLAVDGSGGCQVPYYLNHDTRLSHWQHPEWQRLCQQLTQLNSVRFSAYRTSLKLRRIQCRLSLDRLQLSAAVDVFAGHGLRCGGDRRMNVDDITAVLYSLYSRLTSQQPPLLSRNNAGDDIVVEDNNKMEPTTKSATSASTTSAAAGEIDVPLSVDLCLNWLLDLYDSERTGRIRVLSFKMAIVALTRGHLEEKYRYMFRLIASDTTTSASTAAGAAATNSNSTGKRCLLADQPAVGQLLSDLLQLPRQLGELAAFGGANVQPSVGSCFQLAAGDAAQQLPAGVTAAQLLAWLKQEPQSIVWLPVLHRVAGAEAARHQARCNVCKQYPIVGFRYRCLKCFNFDMCQTCFFTGRLSKSHKLTHPMHEYCTESSSSDDIKDFTKSLRNRFKSKRHFKKHPKLGYLPVQTAAGSDCSQSPPVSPKHRLHAPHNGALLLSESDTRSFSTPESEDEHQLIMQYCHNLGYNNHNNNNDDNSHHNNGHINGGDSSTTAAAVEPRAAHDLGRTSSDACGDLTDGGEPMSSHDRRLLCEAQLLRQHKGRLETRMHVLEQHNWQLEQQLGRLRQLLREDAGNASASGGGVGGASRTGTLQTRSVVASLLDTTDNDGADDSIRTTTTASVHNNNNQHESPLLAVSPPSYTNHQALADANSSAAYLRPDYPHSHDVPAPCPAPYPALRTVAPPLYPAGRNSAAFSTDYDQALYTYSDELSRVVGDISKHLDISQ